MIDPELDSLRVLVRECVEGGDFERALSVIGRLGGTPERDPEMVELEVRCCVGLGDLSRATDVARALALLHPERGPVERLLRGRCGDEDGSAQKRLADPLVNFERVSDYVRAGRPDRAIRVLKRLSFHFPRDKHIKLKLHELLHGDPVDLPDDLSEELPHPSTVAPPELIMPKSGLDPEYDTAVTQPAIDIAALRRLMREANAPETEADEVPTEVVYRSQPEEEITDVVKRPKLPGRKSP